MMRIIPRNEAFFDLFEEQADIAYESISILKQMIKSTEVRPEWHRNMRGIEHRADMVAGRIIKKAEKMFSTPFDTEDIYALTGAFDDVVDAVEEVVARVVAYRFVPDDTLSEFFSLLADGISHVWAGMHTLRNLESQEECRRKMTDCEHAADALLAPIIPESRMLCVSDLLGKRNEDPLTAADVQRVIDEYSRKRMHREIAELSETAVDACKKVFHMLGNIYLKET